MYKAMFSILVVCFILQAAPCFAQQPKKLHADSSRPNIVYVLADDLGYGDLGRYGQKKIETPNIDALAQHGMTFTQHYAFPVCAPSRDLLLTGKNSGHAYIRGNDPWGTRGDVWNYEAMEANPSLEGNWPIPASTVTIAKMLKKAGYRTGLVGKWGLGAPMTAGLPSQQGFDYFYGFIGQRQDHTYYPPHLWESLTLHGTPFRVPLNNKVISPKVSFPKHLNPLDPKNYRKYRQKDYAPKLLLQAALKFIESSQDQPFFLYYPSPLPHVSLQAPQKWVNYYHKKFGDEKPFLGGSYYPSRYPRATYAAMVSTLDEQVGAIVKKLKELGLYKNTLIVFSSDNGPTHNGGSDSPWFDSGGPFKSKRGWGKGYVHEGGIRIPLIAEWPGKIQSNTHSDLISANWDAMPTLCRIAGVKPPRNIQGISYLPTLLGHPKRQKKHPYLYWEFPGYGGQQAVRKGKWKGIRMHIEKGNLKIQLFNLDKDIQEQHDVADQHPRIVEKIKRIMQQEHTTPAVDAFRMKALERGKSS